MVMTKTIKQDILGFKNYHLMLLWKLLDIPLHGKEARARQRFLNLIVPRLQEIESERVRLNKELAIKDEKGEPIIEEKINSLTGQKDKGYKHSTESLEKLNKELEDLQNEFYGIDILGSNREDIAFVKKLVLESRRDLTIVEGQIYEEICGIFENI